MFKAIIESIELLIEFYFSYNLKIPSKKSVHNQSPTTKTLKILK